MRGILYKGTLARSPRCSRHRRIDEAGISAPVAVDQSAANCLEEALWSFTAMRSRCRSSSADVFSRRPLPVFGVIRCSSVHCFQTRITVEQFRCTQAAYCATGKSSFSKADNPFPCPPSIFSLNKLINLPKNHK